MPLIKNIICKKSMIPMNSLKKFSYKLKKNDQYQRKYPSLLDKYKNCTYKTGSFCRQSNRDLNLITCEDKIGIALTLQSYVFNLIFTYLLLPIMDRTERMNPKYMCWCSIGNVVWKEVSNGHTCQCKKG